MFFRIFPKQLRADRTPSSRPQNPSPVRISRPVLRSLSSMRERAYSRLQGGMRTSPARYRQTARSRRSCTYRPNPDGQEKRKQALRRRPPKCKISTLFTSCFRGDLPRNENGSPRTEKSEIRFSFIITAKTSKTKPACQFSKRKMQRSSLCIFDIFTCLCQT